MSDLAPDLAQHPGARFVGLSPAGVQWVAYDPTHVDRMAGRLDVLWDRVLRKPGHLVRQCAITPHQSDLLADELDRIEQLWVGRAVRLGRRFVRAPRWALMILADGINLRLSDDHALDIAETSLIELTDHQVAFGVERRTQSLQDLVRRLRR